MPVAIPFIFRELIFDLHKFHGQELPKIHNVNAIYDHPKITNNTFYGEKRATLLYYCLNILPMFS